MGERCPSCHGQLRGDGALALELGFVPVERLLFAVLEVPAVVVLRQTVL
jgi:hypothetical protein